MTRLSDGQEIYDEEFEKSDSLYENMHTSPLSSSYIAHPGGKSFSSISLDKL
jgi:hypothetical protein